MEKLFTDADIEKISEAVTRAETGHVGEIVPYIAERVDDHDEARWRAATLGALLASLVSGVVFQFMDFWGGMGLPWITLFTLIGASLGLMFAHNSFLARKLLSDADLDRRVQNCADLAFLKEQVFNTEKRTGILIFLAVFERRAVILADSGINQKIPHATWSDLVDELTAGIKQGRPVEALNQTIARCGEILRNSELPAEPIGVNELDNSPRIKEE